MKHLYFKHSNGDLTFVASNVDAKSETMIQILMAKYCKELNPNYICPYFKERVDILGRVWYDVGSKTEEFVIF